MKFTAEPGLFVKISNKYVQRATGMKGFFFDENGEYETENAVLIGVLKQNFKYEEPIIEEPEELSYHELKSKAKELGINTYGMKMDEIMKAIQEVEHAKG